MSAIDDLVVTVARLRAPGGCPWDQEQNHQSICDCLVEEVAELLETIDRNDLDHMREELGDLLLHVVMHAAMAQEEGHFTFEDVAREINEKMIRRHPHVFGETQANDTAAVLKQWDEIKATEKKNGVVAEGPFKALPPTLSSILKARDVYKTVQKKKLDAGTTINRAEVARLTDGLTEEKAGDALFALVAACREAGIDPDSALRRKTSEIMRAAVH
ncbi:MAG: MazG family protein [Puniceicoccales bacterium]|jgi:XTP/dITP diphosphohydrolase/tetrapyrrole methylase family protein/MazG family protein|nr:MazG family protein [Puniceicoccales bacterium]